MESIKLIAAGFLLGFGVTYIAQAAAEQEPEVSFIDQAAHDDEELDRVITVQIPQEQ